MSLGKSISEMSIEEINRAVQDRSDWIENYLSISLEGDTTVDMEPLRHWSNELYALNSARIQRFSELKATA